MDLKAFLGLTIFVVIAQAATLRYDEGQAVTVCNRHQEKLDECLKDQLQALIQKYSKVGAPHLNLAPLDPWFIEEYSMDNYFNNPFEIDHSVTKISLHGFSDMKILAVRSNFDDPNNIEVDIDYYIKKVTGSANYFADGFVTEMHVAGKGTITGRIRDLKGTFKIKGHIINKDDEEYLKVDSILTRPTVGNFKMSVTNEVKEFSDLTDMAVTLTNQFWRQLYQIALPYLELAWNDIFTSKLNQITLQIPFNQILSE